MKEKYEVTVVSITIEHTKIYSKVSGDITQKNM